MPPKIVGTITKRKLKANTLNGVGHTISEIIEPDFRVDNDDGFLDDDVRVRFESIIEFLLPHPYIESFDKHTGYQP